MTKNSFSMSLNSLLTEDFLKQLLPALSTGLVVGILLVIIEVSFAALIFSGEMSQYAVRGAGMTVFGALILTLFVTFTSSYKASISLPQDAPVAMLASAGTALCVAMDQAPGEHKFATLTALVALSALATALVFMLIGRFKLANFIRFMPYPVVGGFLAGTGVLLAQGGIGVMTEISLNPANINLFLEPYYLRLWVPGTVFAFVMLLTLNRFSHFLIMPGFLLSGIALYYLVFTIQGISTEKAIEMGFFFRNLPKGTIWPSFPPFPIHLVDWQIIIDLVPSILTIVFLSVVGLLLNVSGLELATKREMNLDRELCYQGLGNAVACLGGSPPGYMTLSLSMLGSKSGADTRLVGLFAAATIGLVLFLGGDILRFFPRPLLGGLVLLIGLFFLKEWLLDSRKKLTSLDYLIVLAIVAVISLVGFLEGVSFGLALTVIIFVFRFSQIPVIARIRTGRKIKSRAARSLPEQKILHMHSDKIIISELSGYIFFGSASHMSSTLIEASSKAGQNSFLILDFSLVHGFDISAISNFQRMAQKTGQSGVNMVMANAPENLRGLLRLHCSSGVMSRVSFEKNQDSAIEWCENKILKQAGQGLENNDNHSGKQELFDLVSDDYLGHLEELEKLENLISECADYLERQSFKTGTPLWEPGTDPSGIYIIEWGNIVETKQDENNIECRMRTLEPGQICGEESLLDLKGQGSSFVAETQSTLFLLTEQNMDRLQTEHPELAARLLRFLVTASAKKQLQSHCSL